jgi:hypothetical protein
MITKPLLFAAMLAALPTPAAAHEMWIERDGAGPARIYLGEPGEPLPEGGDPEFDKLRAPRLVPGSAAPGARRAGYIEYALPPGDVRAIDDAVFAPWGADGSKEGVIYYARAGRADPQAVLPFEFVPAAAQSDRFVLVHKGKPLAHAKVTLISPDKWSKSLQTDAQGAVIVPLREPGRYILTASRKVDGPASLPGGTVAAVHHITTATFVAP